MKGKRLQKWKEFSNCGDIVMDIFFPFKSPLDRSKNMAPKYLFTPETLIDYIKEKQINVGLIIDLTNTGTYYNRTPFERHGIRYIKLACRGGTQCATAEETKMFIGICNQFLQLNTNELIGVHCTHGSNRTGFLICSYLIEQKGIDKEEAIKIFETRRPPGISKEFVIEELRARY